MLKGNFEDKLDADTIIENLTAFKMQKMELGKDIGIPG